MPAISFPRHGLPALHELATRVLDTRRDEGEALSRDLLAGFYDVCMRTGLDRVLAELGEAFPELELVDRLALADVPQLRNALAGKLGNKADFDPGGPRNAKPRQMAECLIAALSLTLTDDPIQTVTLGDDIRVELKAAIASVVDVELAVPRVREAIVAKARQLCAPEYHPSFARMVEHLDAQGLKLLRQPKVPIDASQKVQQALFEARSKLVGEMGNRAIDRAKEVLARADAELAARLEQPITLRLTPRDVAILRLDEARVPKMPGPAAQSLFESLTELLHVAWRAPEQAVRTYSPKETFAVGDLVEHPKFGRGTVTSCIAQRVTIEFADGPLTLQHVGTGKS